MKIEYNPKWYHIIRYDDPFAGTERISVCVNWRTQIREREQVVVRNRE
jgi:hypothetical protein